MASVFLNDWIPLYVDAGAAALIRSLARQGLAADEFMAAFNAASALPGISWAQFKQLYADLRLAGELLDVQVDCAGDPDGLPPAVQRYAAPTGLGAAEWGVWFSTPDTGTEIVRWYLNGVLVLRREQDLTANRSATIAELRAQAGDVVQVCIEAGGVVGWWGRVAV